MHPLTCDQCLYKKHGHPTELWKAEANIRRKKLK
jgi:hypothetical protein